MTTPEKYDWRQHLDTPRFIAELPHSVAYLRRDQEYRGRTVVWMKEHFDDLLDVPGGLRITFNDEMMRVAQAIRESLQPARLNYASLGNVANHVHWHVIPRYPDDPLWGGPPWPRGDVPVLSDDDYRALAAEIRGALD